jgi:hypothetical protein
LRENRGAAHGVLVALKKDPFKVFKEIKLVKVRKIFPAPAAQVQENLATSLQMKI